MGKKWIVILVIVIIAVFLYFKYQDGSLTLPTGSEVKDSDGDTIQDKYDKCPFLYVVLPLPGPFILHYFVFFKYPVRLNGFRPFSPMNAFN